MQFTPAPAPIRFDSQISDYQRQADELLAAYRAQNPDAIAVFKNKHPRFLNREIPWLPLNSSDAEIIDAELTLGDAQLAIARIHCFQDWDSLCAYAESVRRDPAVFRFESAVEAVIHGDTAALRSWIQQDPDLMRARSTRVTNFDPPEHRATLLHYVAANGVEDYRQKSPPNAVEIAQVLLESGADPNAPAEMYGGKSTVMGLLVSSVHPAQAGVQVPLIDLLMDHGASADGCLKIALVFGYPAAAEALMRRGVKIQDLQEAAALGRTDEARRMLPEAAPESRHAALSLAAQYGHAEIMELLLDAGEDPNRFNPPGTHRYTTPLHQAAFNGHEEAVRLLIRRGASLSILDRIYGSTPEGWARHAGQLGIAKILQDATLEP